MENVNELITFIDENLYDLNSLIIIHKIKDICFKNYDYKPRFNEINCVICEWKHKINHNIITIDDIRQLINVKLYDLLREIQSKCISESQNYAVNHEIHNKFMPKIKKIAEICIIIRKDYIFKQFIDYYRNGYFN